MSYPQPPGLKPSSLTTSTSNQSHASLPPRPTASAAPLPFFKPAFSSNPSVSAGAPGTGAYQGRLDSDGPPSIGGYGGFAPFKPRQLVGSDSNHQWTNHSPTVSAPPAPPAGFSAPTTYPGPGYNTSSQPSQAQQSYQQPNQDHSVSSAPQIRNPFPVPSPGGRGVGGGRFLDTVDPEMEAQIAQWQSAYSGRDSSDQTGGRGAGRGGSRFGGQGIEGAGSASGANAGPLGGRGDSGASAMTSSAVASAADVDTGVASVVSGPDGKQKTVVRTGGGQTWTDTSLLEWDPAHFRLFVGNLAGEVTDESLLKAFSRYPSVQKARVVRDKRTTKSKGYGFVSFSDGEEYFQAAREMQGKYIGSHPVLLRRSTTEIRPVVPGNKKGGKYGRGGKGGHHGEGNNKTGAGVQKKSNKTKGGLRVLG